MLSLFDTNPYKNPIRWFGKIKYMYLRFKFSGCGSAFDFNDSVLLNVLNNALTMSYLFMGRLGKVFFTNEV